MFTIMHAHANTHVHTYTQLTPISMATPSLSRTSFPSAFSANEKPSLLTLPPANKRQAYASM